MNMWLGIDTSCYTTSVCAVTDDERIIYDGRRILSVPDSQIGLRQSEAVFQHINNLPVLFAEAMKIVRESTGFTDIKGICVSEKPVGSDRSYMPVFVSGVNYARVIASALDRPLYSCTHQQGHIMAALKDSGLGSNRFLALHLSGGTTDILLCNSTEGLETQTLAHTSDLAAGQFVDRAGVRMGLPFPAGKALEALALSAVKKDIRLSASVTGLSCSFSGPDTRLAELIEHKADSNEAAYAVYDCINRVIAKLLINAAAHAGIYDVILTGGVMSSGLLRKMLVERMEKRCRKLKLYFGEAHLASDNAAGVALYALKYGQSSRGGFYTCQKQ